MKKRNIKVHHTKLLIIVSLYIPNVFVLLLFFYRVLKHPNVLSLMGVVTSGPNILVMLEYCSHGNLKTFLVSRRREAANFKSSGQLLKMSKDLAAGLGYLHTMSIAHK